MVFIVFYLLKHIWWLFVSHIWSFQVCFVWFFGTFYLGLILVNSGTSFWMSCVVFHLQVPVVPVVVSSYNNFYNKKEKRFDEGRLFKIVFPCVFQEHPSTSVTCHTFYVTLMCFICLNDVFHLSHWCISYVTLMYFMSQWFISCHTHIFHVPHSCVSYVTLMHFICHSHAILMSHSCISYVTLMYLCDTDVYHLSHWCIFICHTRAFHLSHSCISFVTLMHFICHTDVFLGPVREEKKNNTVDYHKTALWLWDNEHSIIILHTRVTCMTHRQGVEEITFASI